MKHFVEMKERNSTRLDHARRSSLPFVSQYITVKQRIVKSNITQSNIGNEHRKSCIYVNPSPMCET